VSIANRDLFLAPPVYQLKYINQLKREVFGPILHVIRFKGSQRDKVLQDVNDTGYGQTLGVHSPIKKFAERVFNRTKVGSTYINRNMVGAVAGATLLVDMDSRAQGLRLVAPIIYYVLPIYGLV
jgi:RHH-type proline utilization regulon transcriptional repressor/proline dehydrogenase/delta 1-pyrroline-5-carboxylate dehydrogenase